jgi:phosphopentomutase
MKMSNLQFKRIIAIVLDSVGVGAAPDAAKYDDVGSDTFGNIAKAVGGLKMPNIASLGMGNLHPIKGVDPAVSPLGYYGKMAEASAGKDTMTGHWEMMGLFIEKPFQTFTDTGFPDELIEELVKLTGHNVLCNRSASGTEVLDEYGEEHMKTGDMIVYTSADSVLQIAAHEDTFGLDELYRCCQIARELTMKPKWLVGRVIARPFVGPGAGEFKRTSNRHDYALKPYGKTALDNLKEAQLDVISVGKIVDIFDGEGVTEYYKSKSNQHGMQTTIDLLDKDFTGLLFTNLVDFDALWGHRRNPVGYGNELEQFDVQLGELISKLKEDDLLLLTADHGNDPLHQGTDHTREMVFQVYYSPSFKGSGLLPVSDTFADIGATIVDNFKVKPTPYGKSVVDYLK